MRLAPTTVPVKSTRSATISSKETDDDCFLLRHCIHFSCHSRFIHALSRWRQLWWVYNGTGKRGCRGAQRREPKTWSHIFEENSSKYVSLNPTGRSPSRNELDLYSSFRHQASQIWDDLVLGFQVIGRHTSETTERRTQTFVTCLKNLKTFASLRSTQMKITAETRLTMRSPIWSLYPIPWSSSPVYSSRTQKHLKCRFMR